MSKVRDVPTKHKSDIKSICTANNNKFFITCSESGECDRLLSLLTNETDPEKTNE